jgi:hypothetical protein
MEDFIIIQNALHYYKHVEKRGNFKQYDVKRCEQLRDKLAQQIYQDEEVINSYRPDSGSPESESGFG